MIVTGVHAVLFSKDADAVRALFRDTLELPSVDAGGGWPIFALPPAELAAHPSDGDALTKLYLICDDIDEAIAELAAKGVETTGPVSDASFGRVTALKLPGGGELGIYEPRHQRPTSAAG